MNYRNTIRWVSIRRYEKPTDTVPEKRDLKKDEKSGEKKEWKDIQGDRKTVRKFWYYWL